MRCCVQLLYERYMPELEQIKMAIALRGKEGRFRGRHAVEHAGDTVQLVTSNLPELHNWSLNGSVTPSPAQQPQALDLDRLALSGADIFGPAAVSPASTSGKAAEVRCAVHRLPNRGTEKRPPSLCAHSLAPDGTGRADAPCIFARKPPACAIHVVARLCAEAVLVDASQEHKTPCTAE